MLSLVFSHLEWAHDLDGISLSAIPRINYRKISPIIQVSFTPLLFRISEMVKWIKFSQKDIETVQYIYPNNLQHTSIKNNWTWHFLSRCKSIETFAKAQRTQLISLLAWLWLVYCVDGLPMCFPFCSRGHAPCWYIRVQRPVASCHYN